MFVYLCTILLRKTDESPKTLRHMLFQLVITPGASVFFISEAFLLSLEDFPFVLALVVECICAEAETIVGYLLLYPICLLGHLLKLNQSTNQENSRIKKHPSL